MRNTFIVFFAMTAILASNRAMAWGHVGHTAIAYAAEQLLTPEAKEKCHHYLRSTLAYQASWMDHYRSIEGYTDCDWWHSTNIDANYKVVVGKPTTGAYHIERIRKEMLNGGYKRMTDSLVKVNLQYLIHMIGDHHCPVHVRWNKEEHPQFHYFLKHKGKKKGYHSFWDGSVGYWRKGWTAERYYAEMEKLSKSAAKKVQRGDGYAWTQETANVARGCFRLMPPDTEITKMSQEDREAVHSVADRQVQRAAYRLAWVLNEIFKE